MTNFLSHESACVILTVCVKMVYCAVCVYEMLFLAMCRRTDVGVFESYDRAQSREYTCGGDFSKWCGNQDRIWKRQMYVRPRRATRTPTHGTHLLSSTTLFNASREVRRTSNPGSLPRRFCASFDPVAM